MGKRRALLLIFSAIISLVGCSNLEKEEQVNITSENKLIVQKHTENEGQYQQVMVITDKEEINTILKIFKDTRWTDANDKSTYPDYKINDNYAIWILSPDNGIRVKIDSIDKNTFLSKKDSKILYKIILEGKLRK